MSGSLCSAKKFSIQTMLYLNYHPMASHFCLTLCLLQLIIAGLIVLIVYLFFYSSSLFGRLISQIALKLWC